MSSRLFITKKKDVKEALSFECIHIHKKRSYLFWGIVKQDYIALLMWALRNMELHYNSTGVYHKICFIFFHSIWLHYSVKTGITLPKNVADKGLVIGHYGSVVVNGKAKIGKNCCIMNNVNIGAKPGENGIAPSIGNDVYIGPGAVLYGNITIADGCYVGANAVVNKSVLQSNSIIVGVPAKVIGFENTCWWKKMNLNRTNF